MAGFKLHLFWIRIDGHMHTAIFFCLPDHLSLTSEASSALKINERNDAHMMRCFWTRIPADVLVAYDCILILKMLKVVFEMAQSSGCVFFVPTIQDFDVETLSLDKLPKQVGFLISGINSVIQSGKGTKDHYDIRELVTYFRSAVNPFSDTLKRVKHYAERIDSVAMSLMPLKKRSIREEDIPVVEKEEKKLKSEVVYYGDKEVRTHSVHLRLDCAGLKVARNFKPASLSSEDIKGRRFCGICVTNDDDVEFVVSKEEEGLEQILCSKPTATQQYAHSLLLRFLRKCCLYSPRCSVSAKEFLERFTQWCNDHGETRPARNMIGAIIKTSQTLYGHNDRGQPGRFVYYYDFKFI